MNLKRSIWLAVVMASLCTIGNAGITYTCAANIDATTAGTCAYLNSTVAGLYSSTFTNANASIYIQMGVTGLGESTSGYLNLVSYSAYTTALAAEGGAGTVRADAIASLPSSEPSMYSGGKIEVTSALGEALGLSGMIGTTAGGSACFTPGSGGCYNGIITITTPANLSSETGGTQVLYWNQTGGTIPGNAYDFYSVVEHETDEVLGTSSCISTGGSLSDGCGATNASAVDLFRYQSPGTRVFESTTPGAYFSYNGGVTNGADGAAYNTFADGNDYADFATNCAHIQDATGCLGTDLNINTDGNAEINVLDAIGYNVAGRTSSTPEPTSLLLFGSVLAISATFVTRRNGLRKNR